MSRRNGCGWCQHENGEHWDWLLADGIPLAAVTKLTPFSEAADRIHARDHVAQPVGMTASTAPTASTGLLTIEDFARRLVEICSKTALLSDQAEEAGNADAMLDAVESRAEVTKMLTTALNLAPDVAEGLVTEAEATVRGMHRLTMSGLPTDPETLAWFVREAGGPLVADVIESQARAEARSA